MTPADDIPDSRGQVVSIDDYRPFTLQQLLREWAETVSETRRCPIDEDDAAKLAGVLESAADALEGTLNVCGYMWVQRKSPPREGA
jgi:hypothetical protein